MFSKMWWRKAFERMSKTGAQVLVLMVGSDVTGFRDIDWEFLAVSVAGTMVLSFASSIITTPMGPDANDPSAI